MPYITKEARERLFSPGETPHNAGELNFIVTLILDQYWHENDENYQAYNDIMGALEGAKMEMYRRRIGPYEEMKRLQNGEVYRAQKVLDSFEGSAKIAPKEPPRPGPKGQLLSSTRPAM